MGFYTAWLFFHGYYVIMAGEMLFAISKVMMDNAMSGYLYDYLTLKQQKQSMVKYYGYLNFYLSFGTAVGGIIGTYMYSKLGSKIVIFSEIILVLLSVFLVMSLPQIKSVPRKLDSICQKLKSFFRASKDLCKDVSISYYVF